MRQRAEDLKPLVFFNLISTQEVTTDGLSDQYHYHLWPQVGPVRLRPSFTRPNQYHNRYWVYRTVGREEIKLEMKCSLVSLRCSVSGIGTGWRPGRINIAQKPRRRKVAVQKRERRGWSGWVKEDNGICRVLVPIVAFSDNSDAKEIFIS